MNKYLTIFESHSQYVEPEVRPNVSYCIQEDEVHYNSIPIMTVRYNVTDASNPTQLYAYGTEGGVVFNGASMFDKVEIDGVEVSIEDLDSAYGQAQFSEGEHTVKYTLKDPTLIGLEVNIETQTYKLGAMFTQCSSIVSVGMPDSVTSIGGYVFQNCNNLSDIIIPNGVTSIGSGAFYGCSDLRSITIPDSVTSIGDSTFSRCSGLTSIKSLATTAPTIGSNTFNGIKRNGTLTVPSGSTGYDVWMGTDNYYLGAYNWTKVEQ